MNNTYLLFRLAQACPLLALVITPIAIAQSPPVFVAQPAVILRLDDVTGDNDYLDFGELTTYSTLPGADLGPLAASTGVLFAADNVGHAVWMARDLNGDGDALDFAELNVYLDQFSCNSGVAWTALTADPAGGLLLADANGVLFRAIDANADGDALDVDECELVANGLFSPRGMSIRPDGAILVAQDSAVVPVVILEDRNGDGDYLDFAEHISYAESFGAGGAIVADNQWVAFLLDTAQQSVLRLQDLTHDGDALDAGEVVMHANPITGAVALAGDADDHLFVASSGPVGTVYLLFDANADGDALDVGEVTVVATGLADIQSIACATTAVPCTPGDANQDGSVTPADIPPFADALLGQSPPLPLCAIDLNGDGLADARDIPVFLTNLLTP